MRYRADIDGIRAVAVLLVLIFHFDLVALGKTGFIGVDIFFVISGYLITRIIHKEMLSNQFHFGRFLYRRIRRLYPALLASVALGLVAGWIWFLPHRFEQLAAQSILSLLYVINFYFWQNVNYFGFQADYVPLLHFWTLAVEEQFYFFFPLVCLIIWRISNKLLLPAVIAGTLVSFLLGVWLSPIKPEFSFYLMPTRAWELLAGSTLALFMGARKPSSKVLYLLGPLGIGLIVVAIAVKTPITPVPGTFVVLPVLATIALLVGGFESKAPVTRLLSSAPLVWIGKVSYPLYLVHWPIRIFLVEHLLEFGIYWRLFGFALSFVLAAAIYYLIERPIRQNRVFGSPSTFLLLIGAVSTALVVLAGMVRFSHGVPQRFDPEVSEVLAFSNDNPTTYHICENLGDGIGQYCVLGDANQKPDVLVIGDSFALAMAGAFDIWFTSTSRAAVLAFEEGCMPVYGSGSPYCLDRVNRAIDQAAAAEDIDEVILVSIWRQGLPEGGKQFGDRWVPESGVADVFEEQLRKTVSTLVSAGKKVTIIDPLFAAEKYVPETLAGNLAFQQNWPVDIAHEEHERTFATVFKAFESIASPNVRRISLLSPFCDGVRCSAVVDGVPLFSDKIHLAYTHMPLIADILAKEFSANEFSSE